MVIGIIAVLISMLLPVLGRVRDAANTIKCLSNLRQIGVFMQMYANGDRSHRYPCGYTPASPAPAGSYVSYDDLLSAYDGRKGLTDAQLWAGNLSDSTPNVSISKLYACPLDIETDFNFSNILRRTYAYPRCSWHHLPSGAYIQHAVYLIGAPTAVPPQPPYTVKPAQVRDPSGTILLCELRYKFARLGANTGELCDGPADTVPPTGVTSRQIAGGWGDVPLHGHNKLFNYLMCDGHVVTLAPAATLLPGTSLHSWQSANGMWTLTHDSTTDPFNTY